MDINGELNFKDNLIIRPEITDYSETVNVIGNATGSITIDLTLGNIVKRYSPVQIGTDTNWSSVSSSSTTAIALKTDGTLWGAGTNSSGQLGLPVTAFTFYSPIQISSESGWKNVFFGGTSLFAQKEDGSVFSIGDNSSGQLGIKSTTTPVTTMTKIVPAYTPSKISVSSQKETIIVI